MAHSIKGGIRNCSLRVLVSPTPVTFAERRSVLQVLEQHGQIQVFRMTQGYHGNFMSVTRDAETADALIARSPLRYMMTTHQDHDESSLLEDTEPKTLTNLMNVEPSSDAEHEIIHTRPEPGQREFRLEIFPAPDYNHEYTMVGSPLYHEWPSSYEQDRSYVATTLKQSLPHTASRKGLTHWLVDLSNSPVQSMKARRLQWKTWLPSKIQESGMVTEHTRPGKHANRHARHRRSDSQQQNRSPGQNT